LTEFSLDFPRAYGELNATAIFRDQPEDFKVDEDLGFELAGVGEHVFLQILKRGENTAWVAGKIAELAKVNINDIGYAGRKDRHAVTTQWFSVYLPKAPEPDWMLLNSDTIHVISVSRHQQKLRRGDHRQNYFVIRLRDLQTNDRDGFEQRIHNVLSLGVPNYFGEQRFGFNANNLSEAEAILVSGKRYKDKQKRGLMLSAGRSYLFNQILAARIVAGNWLELMSGDSELQPSGPLWGRGRSLVTDDLLALEQGVLVDWQLWCDGLEHAGLSQERRPLRLLPSNTSWRWIENDLELSFSLASGEFATAVLRELAHLTNRSQEQVTESE
jgi:tRNA pseudouridine13 synthase